ncbi:MAG: hypothetical protein LAO20_16755 [Acidobacteriia bacterium]|nr:hypothetical protein [Terriglobia bacterium]
MDEKQKAFELAESNLQAAAAGVNVTKSALITAGQDWKAAIDKRIADGQAAADKTAGAATPA